ncbi:MAG: efflux RND transporter periplasmic adaptor subunit [Myxococcales bacterium]|nr:efflux RND transporter periplasmic adaptor subunit [Myxococcales bacterium]
MTKFRMLSNSSSALALILAATLALTASSCAKQEAEGGAPAGSSEKKAPEESATRVELAILEGGSSAGQFARPGEVIGAREARLAAALGGYVEKVLVESGQHVTKGQVIARVDSSTHSAQLALTRVEIEDAKRELARLMKMGKAIASARVDAAKTRVARAKAQQRIAQNRMQRATIKAPFAGELVDLQLEEGEVAAPGQPIGRLLVLNPISVSVSVTDQDVHSLTLNSSVQIATAGSANPISGRISRIEPAADLRTRTFLVEVEAANPDRKLLPGMIASVEFEAADRGDALMLPQDLLVTKLKDNGVFVVSKDAVARWRPLKLGEIVGSQVEILSGVSRGERIVTVGMRSLSDGDKVLSSREGVCCTNGSVVFDVVGKKPAKPGPEPTQAADAAAAAAKGVESK